MSSDPHTDDWLPPCDLCGGFRFDTVTNGNSVSARRCRDCDLVTLPGTAEGNAERRFSLPTDVLAEAIRHMPGGRVLLLGPPTQELLNVAREGGVVLETPSVDAIGQRPTPPALDHLRYMPETFDGVVATEGLEWFDAPSLVFERSRLWLRPGGTLLVGAWDIHSLPARLRRRSWIRLRATGAHHLMSLDAIRRYAARYGFYIGAVKTRASARDVASSIAGTLSPSWLTEMATLPIALASIAFGMGPLVIVRLSKGGLSTRTIRLDTEAENAQGLAPAMYVGESNW